MGVGDLLGSAGDWIDKGREKAGELVEDAGDRTADRVEDAGWESGANWIRDTSKSAVNRLGADVAELPLGRTDEPKKPVHGSPSKLRATAEQLDTLQQSFDSVGRGLRALDSSRLKGEAADAFRERVAVEPKKWFTVADACEKASKALRGLAGTVEWAQGQAKQTAAQYRKGVKASEAGRTAHDDAVSSYDAAVEEYNATAADQRDPDGLPRRPGAFEDPGPADIEAAEELLAEARSQRNTAQSTAADALRAARDESPPMPSYAEQVEDGVTGLRLDTDHLAGGLLKGTAGIVPFARSTNMLDPYDLAHPAAYATNLTSTATGLVQLARDPVPALQGTWESFDRDRSEGIGRLAPELIGPKGTGLPRRLARTPSELPSGAGRRDLDRNGAETHARRDEQRSTRRHRPGRPGHGEDVPAADRCAAAGRPAAGVHPTRRVRVPVRPLVRPVVVEHRRPAVGGGRPRGRPRLRGRTAAGVPAPSRLVAPHTGRRTGRAPGAGAHRPGRMRRPLLAHPVRRRAPTCPDRPGAGSGTARTPPGRADQPPRHPAPARTAGPGPRPSRDGRRRPARPSAWPRPTATTWCCSAESGSRSPGRPARC